MTIITHDGDNPSIPSAQFTLSPFYHSAVNAVTEPGRYVFCSAYFVDRWLPELGENGVRIVLALRRMGYHDRRTGEKRDEIVVNRAELAKRAGVSEDTLTREMGVNKKTGQLQNWALHHFVEKIRHSRRDKYGRVWQEENGYRVAMDDPIHPDDWPLVEAEVAHREAVAEKSNRPLPPKTQSASPVAADPPQSAAPETQNTPPKTQSALTLKSPYSSIPENTLNTPREQSRPVQWASAPDLFSLEGKEEDTPSAFQEQEGTKAERALRRHQNAGSAFMRDWTARKQKGTAP